MENNTTKTYDLHREGIASLASSPNNEDLKVVQGRLTGCPTAERDYRARLFQFELGRFLIEDTAERLRSPYCKGMDHCQALLGLYDNLRSLEGFLRMPRFEELYDGDKALACSMVVQARFQHSFRECFTEEDAECVMRQVGYVLEERPQERVLLFYHLVTNIHREIMQAGLQHIGDILNEEEKLRYNLLCLVSKTPPYEYPLFLSALRISGTEAAAVLPHDIIDTDNLEQITVGLKSLKDCYHTLSPQCFGEQMRNLLPGLQRRIVGELAIAIMSYDIELPLDLGCKFAILNDGMPKASMAYKPAKVQKTVNARIIRDLLMEAFGMILAIDDDVATQCFTALFHRLQYTSGIECEVIDFATGNLADYVLAAVCAEFRKQGYAPWPVTLSKLMLYYAIRFAMAGGNLAFWETPTYAKLMQQVGA